MHKPLNAKQDKLMENCDIFKECLVIPVQSMVAVQCRDSQLWTPDIIVN